MYLWFRLSLEPRFISHVIFSHTFLCKALTSVEIKCASKGGPNLGFRLYNCKVENNRKWYSVCPNTENRTKPEKKPSTNSWNLLSTKQQKIRTANVRPWISLARGHSRTVWRLWSIVIIFLSFTCLLYENMLISFPLACFVAEEISWPATNRWILWVIWFWRYNYFSRV